MECNKIGLLFSLSRYKTDVNISTSTDCYLVTGSIGVVVTGGVVLGVVVPGGVVSRVVMPGIVVPAAFAHRIEN